MGDLQRIAGMLVLLALAGAFFRTLSRIHILYAGRDVELSVRSAFYARLTEQTPAFFQSHATGDLMSRITNDLTQIRLMLGPGLLNLVNTLVAYSVAIPLMLLISVKLTCIIFTIYPPTLLLIRFLGRQLYVRNRRQQQSLGQLSNLIQENLVAAPLVRAFGIEQTQKQHFDARNAQYFQHNLGMIWIRTHLFRIAMSLASVSTLLAVYFGAYDIVKSQLTLGQIIAIVEYMALLSGPTFSLGWVSSLWQRGVASMARIDEIMDETPEIRPGQDAPGHLAAELTLRHLHVGYPGQPAILQDLDLQIPVGQTLGIVGPIGSGKTTLLRALLRLINTAPKQIYLGGHDITKLTFTSLRHMFAYVPQNPSLFSKSLQENIAFGQPDSTKDQILHALNLAAFDTDLQMLSEGLQTPIGERGLTLSGGQKQRCAIARALLLNAPILLLDDALSAVDTQTEARILKNLQNTRQGKTTLIVTHRLSAVEHADHIIVLEQGRIVQQGTPAQLRSQPGLYAQLAQQHRSIRSTDPMQP